MLVNIIYLIIKRRNFLAVFLKYVSVTAIMPPIYVTKRVLQCYVVCSLVVLLLMLLVKSLQPIPVRIIDIANLLYSHPASALQLFFLSIKDHQQKQRVWFHHIRKNKFTKWKRFVFFFVFLSNFPISREISLLEITMYWFCSQTSPSGFS